MDYPYIFHTVKNYILDLDFQLACEILIIKNSLKNNQNHQFQEHFIRIFSFWKQKCC